MGRSDRLIHADGRVYDWIAQRSGLVRVADFVGIARELDGEIVAAAGYDHHQDASCSFHIAALPQGINRTFLWKLFEVPFRQWNYSVLLGIIQSGNVKSLNLARRLGFEQFSTLPGAHPSGSLDFFRLYATDCHWLEKLQKSG